MFNFNLRQTEVYEAVKWSRSLMFRFAAFFKKLFLFLFVLFFLLFFFRFTWIFYFSHTKFLGASIIFLCLGVYFLILELFFNSKKRNSVLSANIKQAVIAPEKQNLAQFLCFETAQVCWNAENFAKKNKIFLNSSILFYFILKDNHKLDFIFSRLLLSRKEIKKQMEKKIEIKDFDSSILQQDQIYSSDFQETIRNALEIACEKEHKSVKIGDILIALSKNNLFFREILINKKLKSEDIENMLMWQDRIENTIDQRKKFWKYENLIQKGSIAKDWAMGYTITLDKYAIDWTKIIKHRAFEQITVHNTEITAIERVLSRSRINNVLLAGKPGTGRKSIIQGLAQKCLIGKSVPDLNYARVIELDLPLLLSQIKSFEEAEAVLNKIFEETVFAGNIILVIDEFHHYIKISPSLGSIDISGILYPFLGFSKFRIVAITTYAGLHKHIEKNTSLISRFEKIEVLEPSKKETLILLENLVPEFEKKYNVFITGQALKNIIKYSERYFPNIAFPKKSIDLLDETATYVSSLPKKNLVLAEDVAEIVSNKTEIPIGEIEVKEKEILLNLEKLIHKRIINQEEAVKEISSALRRARAEITVKKKPIGSFLFLGSTGVGKTETAKVLKDIYFGSRKKIIRLDMSEFQTTKDISRLIGSVDQQGLLTTKIRQDPFSLILLDEIEKAHSNVLNLFLQVLDEGHLTDGFGRKVSFLNAIIIATSNAGANIIWEDIKQNKELNIIKQDLLSLLIKQRIFNPEFINRFDAVVVFKPLSKNNFLDIAELMLKKVKKGLEQKEIEFIITDKLKEKIVELSYSPVFGAREMKRIIQNKIENVLAKAILSGEIKAGDKIELDSNSFQISKKF